MISLAELREGLRRSAWSAEDVFTFLHQYPMDSPVFNGVGYAGEVVEPHSELRELMAICAIQFYMRLGVLTSVPWQDTA